MATRVKLFSIILIYSFYCSSGIRVQQLEVEISEMLANVKRQKAQMDKLDEVRVCYVTIYVCVHHSAIPQTH